MTKGFFNSSALASQPRASTLPQCGACGLLSECQTPKMPPSGQGKKKVLIVGEAPGADEDAQGTQFVGKAGQRLRRELKKVGIDLDRDCRKTNSLACRPPGNKLDDKKIPLCRPLVTKEIHEFNPRVIIPLGGAGIKSVIGSLWKEDVGQVGRWTGWAIPSQQLNAWICPSWHPSYLEREKKKLLDKYFASHIKRAFSFKKRPWDKVPDWKKQVQRVYDPDEAAKIIRKMIQKGGLTSWDYETTTLKPDAPWSEIVSCSICWRGKKTIAYPWTGAAIDATIEYLKSDVLKIGSNIKFEHRWSKALLDVEVQSWYWDVMQAAHVLDNRKGITSVKFQSFVLLGFPVYNAHIEPFLKSSNPYKKNDIRDIELSELLLYNGLDSILQYYVALKQMKQMGVKL